MSQIETYHDSFDIDGGQMYDKHNKCSMLERIEIIASYPQALYASYPWVKEDNADV